MIENLIHTLQSSKIGLKVVDGSLKINAPKDALTPTIIDEIKAHKNELIALLSSSLTFQFSVTHFLLATKIQRLRALGVIPMFYKGKPDSVIT